MKGWIIYKDTAASLRPEAYEVRRLVEAGEKAGIALEVYAPEQFDLTVTREDERSILLDGEYVGLPDFIMPRMGAGTTYFALAIIRHLERLGVYSVNSSSSIDTVKDKLFAQQILAENNLPTPKTMLVKFPVDVLRVEKILGFPVVVKTLSGSQGSGVFLSQNKNEFRDLMQLIEVTSKNANIILQEFIADSRGRDLRVFTIGGRAVACFERRAEDDSFKANFSAGGNVFAHEITPEIEWLATHTANILNLDVAGIDLLFNGDHYMICEANSSPGFEGLESCLDRNMADEIMHFLRIRLGMFQESNTSGDTEKKESSEKHSDVVAE